MKKLLYLIPILLILISFRIEAKTMPQYGFGFFYSHLEPYGEWVEFDYGIVAFRPNLHSRAWAPYTQGHWIWTDDGWYWDSYESFGAITYHYGRWFNDSYYGWIWLPDYDYAPAWVEWRYDNDYIGWAPLSPYAEYHSSYGIRYSHPYSSPYEHWHFVSMKHFCNDNIYNKFVIGETIKYRVFKNTRTRNEYDNRNGRIVNRGFDVQTIRDRGGEVRERSIERVNDFNRLKENDRDNTKIRALVVDRNQISGSGNEVKTREFTRSEKSSLELKNVQIGRDENRTNKTRSNVSETGRNNDRKTNVKETEKQRVLRENQNKTNTRKNEVNTPPVRKNDVKENTRQNVNQTDKQRVVRENENKSNTRKNEVTTPPVRKNDVKENTRQNVNQTEKQRVLRENENKINTRKNEVNTPPIRKNDVKENTRQNVNQTEKQRVVRENENKINKTETRNNTQQRRDSQNNGTEKTRRR